MFDLRIDHSPLKALAAVTLVLVLALPAALAFVERTGTSGGADRQASPASAEATDASTGQAGRFWAAGGSYDALVTFERPCVVEWRLDLERRGASGDIGSQAVSYRQELLRDHNTFKDALVKVSPYIGFKDEWTTVLNGIAVRAPAEALDWAAAQGGVAGVQRDGIKEADLSDSVPLINADDLWATTNATGSAITGKGTIVAILDTGAEYSHPDLGGTKGRASDLANVTAGTHKRIVSGYNFVASTSDFWDGHGHGTHCAGIVGASGTVKGVAPECKFRIYKVLSDAGWGYTSWIISGIERATDPNNDGDTKDHSDVISMSLGGFGHPDDDESKAVDNAMDAGVVVAVATANSGPRYETIQSPGCARKVISVGATWKDDSLASFSSIGPSAIYHIKPDVTAPGVFIYSTYKNNGYTWMSGTSMATPHVAGASALLVQAHRGWTSQQVKEALMGTAKDVGYNAYRQGAGRIDCLAANGTVALAEPPSVSLGRLGAASNTTDFTVTFTNARAKWTNGTLSYKLAWALTPLYASSGNATDLAASMLKANVTSVNISPSGTFKVKFTVTYGPDSHVGHHLGEIKLTAGTATVRIPIAFYLRAPILLVDDDNTGPGTDPPYNNWNPDDTTFMYTLDSSKRVGDALGSLGWAYDVLAPLTWYDGPTKDEMSNYRLVIWNCGFDYAPSGQTLTANDRAGLRTFVDGGGKLWLMGPLVLYDYYGATNKTSLPSGDFFRATLGVGAIKRHAGTPDPIKGTAGTMFASISWDVSTAFGGGSDYGQNVTPTDKAYQVLSGPTTDMWGGKWTNVTSAIARRSGTNRTLFFAFEFGQIAGATDRKACVEKAIGWFDILPHGAIGLSGAQEEGSRLDLSASVLDPRASERYEFDWDLSYDGSTFASEAKGAKVGHIYPDNGDYTVALQVKEGRTGLTSPLVTRSVPVINVAPEAHINTSSPGNEGMPISFWGNATDGGSLDTFTWEWDFDYDGTTFTVDSTSRNATNIYADDGAFYAALRVTDNDGAVSEVNTSRVVVLNVPPTGTIFTQGISNEGESVAFTSTVSDPGADLISVEWDFEYDGKNFHSTGAGTSVDHTYLDDGVYTVLMRLTDDDGGVADITLQVTVRNLPPVGAFITSSPIIEGGILDVNSSVTDPGLRDTLLYEWDFDYNGLVLDPTATTINSSRQYLQDGTYTVALRVRDGDGGELFLTRAVTVLNVAPRAILEGPPASNPPKEGSSAQFNAKQIDPGLQDTFTYLWDFGDGTNSTAKAPLHTFWDNGTYSVTLRVTDEAGAFGTAILDVMVANVAPNATVAVTPMTLFENQTVLCQAEGRDPSPKDQAALAYTWNFGDGQFSSDREVRHTYLDDGNYTVTLTVSDGFDLTTYQRSVVVENVPPRVVATADRDHILEGESVSFVAMVTDPGPLDTFTVHWDLGDGTTSTAASFSHRFLQDGHYVVLLTVTDDDGGSNATTFLVSVANVRPAVSASSTATEIAEGQSVTFTGSWTDPGALDTFTAWWDFGDGTNSSSPQVSHAFDENGTYTVVFTVTDETGASSSAFFIVTVANVVPTVAIVVSPLGREIDEGGSVTLTGVATDPGRLDVITFRWDLGDGTPAITTQSVSHRYLDNKAYRVVLTVEDDDGGRNSTTVTITVNNVPPVVTATVDRTETTMGREVAFTASATDVSPVDEVSYSWNFGDGATSTLPSPTHNYQVDGRFEVLLIVSDDDGGQTVWTTIVTVLPDLDGDGIPDSKDPDIDGDGVPNKDDDFPRDPARTKDWASTYLMLLLIVVVAVAVVAYVFTSSRRRRRDGS